MHGAFQLRVETCRDSVSRYQNRRGKKIVVPYWYIDNNFTKERSGRIGASDIPALFPNPEKPTETLAGYGRTPVTVYQEKVGEKPRDPAGLPAEMGDYLEVKILELFVRAFTDRSIANVLFGMYQSYGYVPNANAIDYQDGPFLHHTQFHRDGMIVHPDLVFDPEKQTTQLPKKSAHGLTIRFDRPFLVEAKSAISWAARRPEGSMVKGYDLKLKEWQGIPLKHYLQVQDQMALMEVEDAYLALLYDTSQFEVWHIRASKKHQRNIIDIAGRMVRCIETKRPPADLAINKSDIIALYPELSDDFAIIDGEERDNAVRSASAYKQAKERKKIWEDRMSDASDALAVIMKDRTGIQDGGDWISKWKVTRPSEAMVALSVIKAEHPLAYAYLKRKGLLTERKGSRSVNVVWKGDE